MKFCQICGRPLNDGEVCNCQAQQAAPQRPAYQQAPQQPYPQAAPQQPYPQAPPQPYPPRPASAGGEKFMKALQNIPVSFLNFFKSSDRVIGTAKSKNDVILPALYCAIFFLVNLIVDICYFARMTADNYSEGLGYLEGVFGAPNSKFQFGYVLLAALIMTVLVCVLYVGARFLVQLIFAKKAPLTALIDSFIEFGMHLIPVCCILLVGGLFSLITAWFMPPFIGLAIAYLVVVYITESLKDAQGFQNKFVVTVVLAVSVMIVVGFVVWMMHQMFVMNYEFDTGIDYNDVPDYSYLYQ